MSKLTYTTGALDSELNERFESALAEARSGEQPPLPHLIGGEEVREGEVLERREPANTEAVASRLHVAGAEQIDRAVAAARAAQPEWRRTPYERRCELLDAAAEAIDRRKLEIAAILAVETGKTRVEAIAEVEEGIDLIRTYTREMRENEGFERPLRSFTAGERSVDVLRPYGVFGVVGPFNFPFALAVNMSAAALVAGNGVVLKPSEDAAWSGAVIADALAEAGLPQGIFNIVHGGPETGKALVRADVDGIAFTGSAEVGREIASVMSSGPFLRPALMEMGGKNPTVVSEHADLEAAAEGVARAAFGLSGQKCSACSRAIVVGSEERYERFVELLGEEAGKWTVGDPADPEAQLGPVINEAAAARFERAAGEAARDGRVVAGGGRPELPGHYVEPTVVADLPRGHRLTRDELFLPFVTVTRVDSFDAAIEEANDVVYGLTAGVFSEKEDEVNEFLDRIEAGITYVNRRAGATTGAWPGAQSFCGWKASGSTGKGGLGPYYVPQFMREQCRTYA